MDPQYTPQSTPRPVPPEVPTSPILPESQSQHQATPFSGVRSEEPQVPQVPTQQTAQSVPPMAPMDIQPQPKHKKSWVKWLVFWLAAIPLGIVITFTTHFVFDAGQSTGTTTECSLNGTTTELAACDAATGTEDNKPVRTISNVVAMLLGLYGLLGWIPFLVVLSRSHKT